MTKASHVAASNSELDKTYEHSGAVVVCESGFHACEYPLHVLRYYPASKSRFAIVKQSGELARHSDDTKIASARITIDAEITLPQLVERAVKWVFDRAKWTEGAVAKEANEGATASGYSGAATASGNYGKARGKDGCALFLVYRNPNTLKIMHAWAGIVGQNGIEAMVWYRLDAKGVPVRVDDQ